VSRPRFRRIHDRRRVCRLHLHRHARRCHKIEDHVTFREAALGEPLAVAVRAVTERTSVHAGDLEVVTGPGSIGLLTMQIARLEGARVALPKPEMS
jgi:threonine dehydrogenase-like Zn-dependent dehydrogenase